MWMGIKMNVSRNWKLEQKRNFSFRKGPQTFIAFFIFVYRLISRLFILGKKGNFSECLFYNILVLPFVESHSRTVYTSGIYWFRETKVLIVFRFIRGGSTRANVNCVIDRWLSQKLSCGTKFCENINRCCFVMRRDGWWTWYRRWNRCYLMNERQVGISVWLRKHWGKLWVYINVTIVTMASLF